jgi:hypothetical protein
MRSRFGGTMTTVVLSSVLSASVAVVVTQVVAPQYASAKSHSKSPTLTSLSKAISSDYSATNKQLGVIESDLASLKTSVAAVSSNASAANTNANAASSAVTAITPVVHTIAERLYDTCALTSSIWARSYPDLEGQSAAFTINAADDVLSALLDVNRCYAADAQYDTSDPEGGGDLLSTDNPDDSWTAKAP